MEQIGVSNAKTHTQFTRATRPLKGIGSGVYQTRARPMNAENVMRMKKQ
jgi:hypothetical protein